MTTEPITAPDWHEGGSIVIANVFASDVIEATRSEQEIEHGLGSVPKVAFAFAVNTYPNGNGAYYSITEGEHDDRVCRFTVSILANEPATIHYRVFAIA